MVEIKTKCPVCHNRITIPYIEIKRGRVYLHDTFKDINGNPVKVKVTRIGRSPRQPSFDMTFRIVTPRNLLRGGFTEGNLWYTSLSHAQLNWKELKE